MTITGTGVDIAEVRRIRKAIERWGDSFLERIFTPTELDNARKRNSLYLHLAGRFAAKEAVFKAFGDNDLGWKDIQIINDEQGRPFCQILNNGKSNRKHILISISHVKTYAVACAVVSEKS